MTQTTFLEPEPEDNHKGQKCPYKDILCQEGYCSGCQVFIDWSKSLWD